MGFARIALGLSALAFAGFGVACLAAPVSLAATVGIVLPEPAAVIDFRATYGGFEVGFALFLVWCLRAANRVRSGLVASALAIAGFACTRLVALPIDGPPRPIIYWVVALELSGVAVSLFALRHLANWSRSRRGGTF